MSQTPQNNDGIQCGVPFANFNIPRIKGTKLFKAKLIKVHQRKKEVCM
jgi:hypothetical protein